MRPVQFSNLEKDFDITTCLDINEDKKNSTSEGQPNQEGAYLYLVASGFRCFNGVGQIRYKVGVATNMHGVKGLSLLKLTQDKFMCYPDILSIYNDEMDRILMLTQRSINPKDRLRLLRSLVGGDKHYKAELELERYLIMDKSEKVYRLSELTYNHPIIHNQVQTVMPLMDFFKI